MSSSTSSDSSSPQAIIQPPVANIHHFLSIKLNASNYLIWRSQFLALLRGYDLLSYVDGTLDDGSPKPAYILWHKQDQLLLSWLLSSLTESVHAQVVGLESSHAVWQYLSSAFSSQSQTRIMQLRLSLHSLKKGADSMSSYLLKARSISDELSLASKPVYDDEMVLYILGGLSSEYASLVTFITTRVTPISIADLHGLLLNEEIRIQSSVTTYLAYATANMALTNRPFDNMNCTQDNRNYNRGRGRGFSGRRGHHRGCAPFVPNQYQYQYQYPPHFNNGNRASSQPFYPRFGSTYTGPTYNDPYNQFATQSQAQYVAQPQAHIASQYVGPGFFSPPPGFSSLHSPTTTVTEWHPDTGAIDHITPDLHTLHSSSPYGGSDSV
ncbi:UBN2_3 domain-containing protein [Cephalotus follicularis]|uniref:UBN2_3 domain-containing protein n=1 Tax=Cephalotus follicularis TaxID=3775 RepID=A0A1Q3C0X1_CEPFO|nr:UBN2_3 domain-containing protein [Cephalotus follicularis]